MFSSQLEDSFSFFNSNKKYDGIDWLNLTPLELEKCITDAKPFELDELFLAYTSSISLNKLFPLAEVLLKLGAKLNNPSPLAFINLRRNSSLRDSQGALNSDLESFDIDKITQLLEWGASFDKTNYYNLTPFNLASSYCKLDVFKKFLDYGANLDDDSVLVSAVTTGNFEIVKFLLESGANPNAYLYVKLNLHIPFDIDNLEMTALHAACCYCSDGLIDLYAQTKIVRMLIEYGADVNAISDIHLNNLHHFTPLDFAIFNHEKYSEKYKPIKMQSDRDWNRQVDTFKEIVDILKQSDAKYHKTTHSRVLSEYLG
jgi:ankyrin repeat protein